MGYINNLKKMFKIINENFLEKIIEVEAAFVLRNTSLD